MSNRSINEKDICDCCYSCVQVSKAHTDRETLLRRVCALFGDAQASRSVSRHITVINHFLGIAKESVHLAEIPFLSLIIEFLGQNMKVEPLYRTPLYRIIKLCQNIPILSVSSEVYLSVDKISDFFTVLGKCILVIEDVEMLDMIFCVILRLVSKRTANEGLPHAPATLYKSAILNTKISVNMCYILQIIPMEIYDKALDLMFKLGTMSDKCSREMLLGNCVEYLLLRLPLQDCPIELEIIVQTQTSYILWQLLWFPEGNFENAPPLTCNAIRNLRTWLKQKTLCSERVMRNDVMALISSIFDKYPEMDVIRSGLIGDVCLLARATEFGLEGTWAEKLRFTSSALDLDFKKLLLTCVSQFLSHPAMRLIVREYSIIESVLKLMVPWCGPVFPWSEEQKYELMKYCLHILPIFTINYSVDSVCQDIRDRLLHLIQHFSKKCYLPTILFCCSHCLFALALQPNFLPVLVESGATESLNDLLELLVNKSSYTLLLQQIMCFTFCSLVELTRNNTTNQSTCGGVVQLVTELLKRLLTPRDTDSKLDISLLIILGDFIWKGIISNDENRKLFIDKGGVFLMLDVINECEYFVKYIYVSALTDLTEDVRSVTQLVTWRGRKEGHSLLPLLCRLWRYWDEKSGVLRTKEGFIADIENPTCGIWQKNMTAHLDVNSIIGVLMMSTSLRAKIFALYSKLLTKHEETVALTAKTYNIDFYRMTTEDKVTFKIMNYYECMKEGEIWSQLWTSFIKEGRLLLEKDADTLHSLGMQHIRQALYIQQEQHDIFKHSLFEEAEKEMALYEEVNSWTLAPSLKALRDIDYVMRTSDIEYLKKVKSDKNRQLEI